jgi:hypothetical protein
MANDLKTYGDLKNAIKTIATGQRKEKVGGVGIDALIGQIPIIGNIKTGVDLVRAFVEAPDTKKTKTWLDKLQIDDNMSKIIDNAVENGFIQYISKEIESQQDSKPLEQDFNMNQKLVDFLKNNYQGRTVTGIKENNMKKELLKKFIREEITKLKQEATLPANQPSSKPTNQKVQGATLNIELLKQLAPNIPPTNIQAAVAAIKGNKSLIPAQNKTLADLMVAMIKTSDDTLLNKIFQNFKSMEIK